jgi:hypothetical protein
MDASWPQLDEAAFGGPSLAARLRLATRETGIASRWCAEIHLPRARDASQSFRIFSRCAATERVALRVSSTRCDFSTTRA